MSWCDAKKKKKKSSLTGIVIVMMYKNISALVLPLGRSENGRCAFGQVRGPISIITMFSVFTIWYCTTGYYARYYQSASN